MKSKSASIRDSMLPLALRHMKVGDQVEIILPGGADEDEVEALLWAAKNGRGSSSGIYLINNKKEGLVTLKCVPVIRVDTYILFNNN